MGEQRREQRVHRSQVMLGLISTFFRARRWICLSQQVQHAIVEVGVNSVQDSRVLKGQRISQA